MLASRTVSPTLLMVLPRHAPPPAPQPPEFYEWLRRIAERPSMYFIPEPTLLRALEHWLEGYEAACVVHGRPALGMGWGFSKWLMIHKRYPLGGANVPWSLLLGMNHASEAEAWAAFFTAFREYHREMTGHDAGALL